MMIYAYSYPIQNTIEFFSSWGFFIFTDIFSGDSFSNHHILASKLPLPTGPEGGKKKKKNRPTGRAS